MGQDVSQGPEGLVYRPEPRMGMSKAWSNLRRRLTAFLTTLGFILVAGAPTLFLFGQCKADGGPGPRTSTSARPVGHRVQGHAIAAVLKRPRPHVNATPEGRRAAHRGRAWDVGFLHSMDGVVVRTCGACARFPQDFDLSSIVAAGRSGGLQSPPGDGIKHGLV